MSGNSEPRAVRPLALLGPSAFETGWTMTAHLIAARPGRPASDYSALLAEVRGAGLLDRSGLSYLPRILAVGAMAGAGLALFIWLGESWWQLATAAYLAVVLGQIGFLGHDAGHQQVFPTRRDNDRLGIVLSNLGIGLSYGWWVDKHNRHHQKPNDVDNDPDVQRNVLAWTGDQADSQRGPLRVVARHQAAFFFPFLLLEAVNLHVASVRSLLARPRERRGELALLTVHVVAALGLVFVVLSPVKALVFLAVQQGLLGLYLGCSFAPNHKGMLILDGSEEEDHLDFVRRQVLTSRNVVGSRALAAALGGLNFQIEHHLFPSMPCRNLRRCQPLVKRWCAAHDVSYCETSLLDSYGQTLRYLRDIRPAELAPREA
jgi:fatty acid desaturase